MTESHRFVRRRTKERFNEECLRRTVKHPPAIMIWSCISTEGPGPIYFVEGTLRKEQYKNILTDILLPYVHSLPSPNSEYTFMQDGAPCHTARFITNFLDESELSILPWPGNSPDLNPIENCWALLKSKVYARPNTSLQILKQNITDIWQNDEDLREMINNCIRSLPTRIREVIINKGGVTKY